MNIQNLTIYTFLIFVLSLTVSPSWGQLTPFQPNYDETRIPDYTLPDPQVCEDGTKVTSAETWREKRRFEIMRLFEQQVYGKTPEQKIKLHHTVTNRSSNALAGKAIRKEIRIAPVGEQVWKGMTVLIFLPIHQPKPVPTFLGLNFSGNHAIHPDPEITLSQSWFRNNHENGFIDHRATDKSRGISRSRWPVEQIIDRGYGLATIYYGDIDPDFDDNFKNGVHPLFYKKQQKQPAPDEWGSIGAWAWGLSRAMDYFETDPEIDHKKIILMGHSRLGKTALWAGAQDQRFALVISNNSGCGGAALSMRRFGETVGRINTSFPHWFCDNFNKYSINENALPVDQHMLLTLIAPRPMLVCSAEDDRWADPKGEFMAAREADRVYRLLGTDGLAAKDMPELNRLIDSTIGYRIRPGKHDVKPEDWQAYMDFADKHLR